MTTTPPDNSQAKPRRLSAPPWLAVMLLIAAMTAMRLVYAGVMDLRTDEAYYWTWSKESVLSFLDHPPAIAWLIRFGTAIFGDTNLGVRFGGVVAMLVTQLLLADIVRRVTHDFRAVAFALHRADAAAAERCPPHLMAERDPRLAAIFRRAPHEDVLRSLSPHDPCAICCASPGLATGLSGSLAPLTTPGRQLTGQGRP